MRVVRHGTIPSTQMDPTSMAKPQGLHRVKPCADMRCNLPFLRIVMLERLSNPADLAAKASPYPSTLRLARTRILGVNGSLSLLIASHESPRPSHSGLGRRKSQRVNPAHIRFAWCPAPILTPHHGAMGNLLTDIQRTYPHKSHQH